ncbi:tyrosine-type recombinase/integrase [Acetobacter persici]|uniref:tyrosine-type recombinase/integrase n=1 Tax=Acetobacter persici TaxID=1076596 RepID=UPI0039EC6A97
MQRRETLQGAEARALDHSRRTSVPRPNIRRCPFRGAGSHQRVPAPAYTGCRLRENQRLKWEYVFLDEGVIRLPDSKNGARTAQLGESAAALLKRIPMIAGNPYVITGRKDGGHLTDLEKPWRRIRKKAGLENARTHDLRHSFASDALELGDDLIMIGQLRPIAISSRQHVMPTSRKSRSSARSKGSR